ncbi:hypothetical protein PRZ48_014975 [Zasmidium cellare]|uniref:F-box domain-containing protein n=1 Tax=Zasmidium cellare TaxID=395010 RepID=A0ABR0DXC0_ZASCE|nr:hypothetical protein PRZ48_014975 [Zasmidium cellare]
MVARKRSASSVPKGRTSSKKPRANSISTHVMLTRGVTTEMTRNAVVNTPELLVGILQHLKISDLVAFRRVSKYFKATIDKSPQVQVKMFLRNPPTSQPFWMYNHGTKQLYTYVRGDAKRYGNEWVVGHSVMRPSVLNPLLFKTDQEERRPPLMYRARICEGLQFTQRPNLARTKSDCLFHRMFVCLPPVPVIEFQISFNPSQYSRCRTFDGWRYPDDQLRGRVKNKKGVKFGDLIKKIRKSIQGCVPEGLPTSGFRVHVSDKKQSKMSQIWTLGAIFVSEEEQESIEGGVEQPRIISPLAEKMRKPEYLRDEAKDLKKSYGRWGKGDFEFSGDVDVAEVVYAMYDEEEAGVEMDV